MVFEFSDQVVKAFEARDAAAEIDRFVAWWYGNRELLGVLRHDAARATYDAALDAGRQAGIDDNFENRVFLMAATMRLLPNPTPTQQILAMDAIFAPASDAERLEQLAALRGGKG